MNVLIDGILGAWDMWILLAFVVFVLKMQKRKGKHAVRNSAENAGKDMLAQFTGLPQSNGAMPPFYSDNRDRF